jgi:hypothetical protein
MVMPFESGGITDLFGGLKYLLSSYDKGPKDKVEWSY